MKKFLLKSSMLTCVAFYSTAMAWADNVVYGLTSTNDDNWNTVFQKVSVDLDSLNVGIVKTEKLGETFNDISGFKCGVTVGDKYLAFVSQKDVEGSAFVSINFTTGKVVTINNFSYAYRKPGYNVSGMTYDEVNNKLYAIENKYGEGEDAKLLTHFYEVNPTNGAITEVATLDTIYNGIASDHKGGLYLTKGVLKGWWPQPQLVKLNADYTTSLVVANTKFSGSAENNNLLTSADGKKVYYSFGVNNLVYDLEGDSVYSNVKSSSSLLGLSYGKSSADGETQEKPYEPEKQTRFLVASYTYNGISQTGDNFGYALGDVLPSELDSRHTNYYYNSDGKLVASLGVVRDYATKTTFANTCTNESLTKNDFDENGNVTSSSQYQWGNYNYETYCWKKNSSATTTYEYDDNNRVAKEIAYDTHFYTYNEDGTLAVDSVVATLTNVRKSVTRYNYENYKVVSYEYDGTYEAYNCFLEYDDAGNKIAEEKYSAATEIDPVGEGYTKFKTDADGNRIYVPTQLQTWEYEGSNLVASKVYNLDETGETQTLTEKISYTPVEEGNYDDVIMRDSTLFFGKWSETYAPQRFVYKDMSEIDAEQYKVNLQVLPDEDNLNTADLCFTLPEIANTRLPKFVIFRDATPIDTVDAMDVIDSQTGKCIYVDSTRLVNGTYTYFVLPIFEVQKGGEPGGDIWMSLDEDTDTPAAEETEYESYFCSNPASVTFDTKLPRVTDFKLVGGEDVKSGTSFNRTHTYYGIFSWKNAADADKYGVVSNKIYLVGTSVPQDSKFATSDSISVKLNDDEEVCLVTRYELGYVCSDTISVKLDDVKLAAGVESVTVDGDVNATFSANVVTLSEPANVAVFTANGQQVYGDKNTTSVSLANLPAATYVVIVEKNGKAHAYKYSTK